MVCTHGNKEVQNKSRLEEDSFLGFLKADNKQRWYIFSKDRNRSYNQDCSDKNNFWRREDDYDACHIHMGDTQKPRESSRSFRVDDLLYSILNKVEGSDEILKEMKVDFSSFKN